MRATLRHIATLSLLLIFMAPSIAAADLIPPEEEDDNGCGCVTLAHTPDTPLAPLASLALGGVLLFGLRRRP